jgi:hypothetical protein
MKAKTLDLTTAERHYLLDVSAHHHRWYGDGAADVVRGLAARGLVTVHEHPHTRPTDDSLTTEAVRYRVEITPAGAAAAIGTPPPPADPAPDGALVISGRLDYYGSIDLGDDDIGSQCRPTVGDVDLLRRIYDHVPTRPRARLTVAIQTEVFDGDDLDVDLGMRCWSELTPGDPPSWTLGANNLLARLYPYDGQEITVWVTSTPLDLSGPVQTIALSNHWRGHMPRTQLVVDAQTAEGLDRAGYLFREDANRD